MKIYYSFISMILFYSVYSNETKNKFVGSYPNGEFQIINTENKIIYSGAFLEGKLNGMNISFSHTGDTLSKIKYKNGKLDGNIKLWYSPDFIKEKCNCNENLGNKLKLVTKYSNNELDSMKIHWYPNGQIRSNYNFKNGKLLYAVLYDMSGNKIPYAGLNDFLWNYFHVRSVGQQANYDICSDLSYYKRLEQTAYSILPDSVSTFNGPIGDTILRGQGCRKLKIGASIEEIESVIGKGQNAGNDNDYSYYVDYEPMRIRIIYRFDTHKVIEIYFINKENGTTYNGKTQEGIGWNSTKQDIKKIYGRREYLPGADWNTRRNVFRYDGISFRFEKNKLVVIGIW